MKNINHSNILAVFDLFQCVNHTSHDLHNSIYSARRRNSDFTQLELRQMACEREGSKAGRNRVGRDWTQLGSEKTGHKLKRRVE